MTVRTEPCLCGGSITADDADPGPEVLRHMRTRRHADWRRRAYFKPCPGVGSPCAVTIPADRDLCQFCRRTVAFLDRHHARLVDVA